MLTPDKRRLAIVAVAAASLVSAIQTPLRAQACPAPPENQSFSTFEEWKAVCSRYGTPYGNNLGSAHCVYDPNWCHRNEASGRPARSADNRADSNSNEGERDAEVGRERAVEAERDRAAEERRKREEFEQQKADALKSLKGVSPDDVGFKGADIEGLKEESTSSLDLKPTDTTPRSSRPVALDRIYWRTVSVPAACLVAGQLKGGAACDVLDAYDLWKILRAPDVIHQLEGWVLKKAGKKTLVISLGPGHENLGEQIDLIKALYQAEAKMFDEIARRIDAEMVEDPAKQQRLTQTAKLDNEAVKALRQQIYAEKEANVRASIDYLRRNPRSKAIGFNCSGACQQLIQAAQGIGVLE